MSPEETDRALRALGELLEAEGFPYTIVIIGGAALQLLGIVDRTTRDVDVVAVSKRPGSRTPLARPPEPLPEPLLSAARQVAVDFGLPTNWLNRGPAGQWDVGLPDGFAQRLHWRRYGALDVGTADRRDLIFFKVEAAADQPTSDSRHFRDLKALAPTDEELADAARWAREKNAGAEYVDIIHRVIRHVVDQR